ncbi:MAG: 50S ribosomal protein L23 [Caldisericaceae bacterium]
MEAYEILIRPVITEKTTKQMSQSKYTFIVHEDANVQMIKKAVEEAFNVKVKEVNIGKVFGKKKRNRYSFTLTPTYKKAIVTLYPGYKIDTIMNV